MTERKKTTAQKTGSAAKRATRKKTTVRDYRKTIVGLFAQTVKDQATHGNWRYVAVRPQDVVNVTYHAGVTVSADCSDGGRDVCFTAGLPDDPAGTAYQSYGNSSSIWWHLGHETDWSKAEPGDPVTFGKTTGENHVTWLWARTGPGDHDWDVWNHGAPGQPHRASLAAEIAYQCSQHPGTVVTLCKLNVPPLPAPTAQDALRAKTGFYAWTAWRESEGAWRGYPAADPSVRPNVPKLIPPSWWVRERLFLAARRKPNKA